MADYRKKITKMFRLKNTAMLKLNILGVDISHLDAKNKNSLHFWTNWAIYNTILYQSLITFT